jgi:hypothetical protein
MTSRELPEGTILRSYVLSRLNKLRVIAHEKDLVAAGVDRIQPEPEGV